MHTDRYDGYLHTPWDRAKVPLQACEHVDDGERVAARRGDNAQYAEVVCAAGYHARVRFADGTEMWRNVLDLARPVSTMVDHAKVTP